jgi:4'-phosphopantetheinyl transferase EntD
MGAIVPPGVVVAESRDPRDGYAPLHPDEEPVVARALDKRRRDFAAGRFCARRALAALGFDGGAVLAGPSREPLWPPGVVGSITHCRGYCAAAVGWEAEIGSIGIDAEPHLSLEPGVAALVCTTAELGWTASEGSPGVAWETVIFSAKESLFKAWFPVTGQGLDFHDVALRLTPATHEFQVEVARPFPADLEQLLASAAGRFAVSPTHVLTCAQLPSRARSSPVRRR